jgi:hypothetical protein
MPCRRTPHTQGWGAVAGLLDFTRYDKDDRGGAVGPELAGELRRLANLFLMSAITLLLFLARALAEVFAVAFIPRPVFVVGGVVMLTGWAMTYVYGVFVTFKARRWAWFALCAIPFTCVPAAVAYAWVRRQEIEREVLGADRATVGRQKRGGRQTRR